MFMKNHKVVAKVIKFQFLKFRNNNITVVLL